MSLPESFLCADAILRLAQNVGAGLRVNEILAEKALREYLPFIATENLLMEAVKKGGDRQQLHEIIRRCSMEATENMKKGERCDLLERLAAHPLFPLTEQELQASLRPEDYIGRCPQQVDAFLARLQPLLADVAVPVSELDV